MGLLYNLVQEWYWIPRLDLQWGMMPVPEVVNPEDKEEMMANWQ
jgi:hypothetical protein